jgi:hypothetical protein
MPKPIKMESTANSDGGSSSIVFRAGTTDAISGTSTDENNFAFQTASLLSFGHRTDQAKEVRRSHAFADDIVREVGSHSDLLMKKKEKILF